MASKLRLFDQVVWFPGADINQKPSIAFVTEIHEKGAVLKLLVFDSGGGSARPIENVRHVTDEESRKHPKLANKIGAWSYLDDFQKAKDADSVKKEQEKIKAEIAKKDRDAEIRDRYKEVEKEAVDLASTKKMPVMEICMTLRKKYSLPVDYARVNKALREAGVVAVT